MRVDTDAEMTEKQMEQWADQLRQTKRTMQEAQERAYAAILAKAELKPAIYMLSRPTTDDYGTVTIGAWGGYLIQIMPMAFNDRLVMTPESSPMTYDHGWCFAKGGAAYLAALVWDPETAGEPVGFIKRIGLTKRLAGQKAGAGEDLVSPRDLALLKELLGGDPQASSVRELIDGLDPR
jgi:hypothetical protein